MNATVTRVGASVPNSRQVQSQDVNWAARLIPGVAAAVYGGAKKKPRSVCMEMKGPSEVASSAQEPYVAKAIPENTFTFLLPGPLKGRSGVSSLGSLILDLTLVGLNWLLIGALISPLHKAFPQPHLLGPRPGTSSQFYLLGIALLYGALITLLGYSEGLYSASTLRPRVSLAKAVLLSTAVICAAHRLQGGDLGSLLVLCGGGVLHFVSLLAWRGKNRRGGSRLRGQDIRNVLILGAGQVGRYVASHVESHPEDGRCVCGFLDDNRPLGNGVIGRVADLAHLSRTGFVDELILATPHDRKLALRVLSEARRLRLDVVMVPELFGCRVPSSEVERIGDLPVICLHEEHLPAGPLLVKRLFDVVGAGLALCALAPFLVLIALFIKLNSKGLVMYTALRAGRKGRPFHCFKFRTMVNDADELKLALRNHNQRLGPFFKIANDPRITRVGRFLRRYSLDELPQLWNVMKGEMSLVGPRPHPLDDFAAYKEEHLARLDVTPGITGLWQVTARREPSFQKGLELDCEYIRTWSLGMDMRILFRTLRAVAQGSGD